MKTEKWKEVKGFEGLYEISNSGNVKSISREIDNGYRAYISKKRILKPSINGGGYLFCILCKNGIVTTKRVHQMVAIAFLNHEPDGRVIVIDHINGNKLDNRVENLQIVTNRENSSTCFRKNADKLSSQHPGVSWFKRDKKWRAQICINGKNKHLGYFDLELEASTVYQNALKTI